jgi:hypothetical protein
MLQGVMTTDKYSLESHGCANYPEACDGPMAERFGKGRWLHLKALSGFIFNAALSALITNFVRAFAA